MYFPVDFLSTYWYFVHAIFNDSHKLIKMPRRNLGVTVNWNLKRRRAPFFSLLVLQLPRCFFLLRAFEIQIVPSRSCPLLGADYTDYIHWLHRLQAQNNLTKFDTKL